MLSAWRWELFCVLAIGLSLLLGGLAFGEAGTLLLCGAAVYFAWHLFNLILLQTWLLRRRSFRLPVSFGVWETVFDGLQRLQSTNRKRKRRLARALCDVRDAATYLPDALVVLDRDKRIEWLNRPAERLLGLRLRRHLGTPIGDFIGHPALEDSLDAQGPSKPLQIPSPVNGAWMLNVQTSASFGGGERKLLVIQNITPIYRLEQARRHFIADVSHELRTPITVFRGYLDAIRDAAPAPSWANPVAQMDEQALRMQSLVDDLLTLSRLEMADRSPPDDSVPVPDLLAVICAEATALSGAAGHKITLSADPDLRLLGDEDDLRRAFSNLIFNGVRHTPAGTRIEVLWEGAADQACLTVSDRGEGIAAHHLPRLMDRFYRVDSGRSRSDGGSGLGLAIVKQVLDRYGAELRIESKPGAGSSFTCRFPASVVERAPPVAPRSVPAAIEALRDERQRKALQQATI